MIILDTNVVSALMRKPVDPAPKAWLDRLPRPSIWTTSVTLLELRYGLAILRAGQRRDALSREVTAILTEDLQGRILGLGEAEAIEAAHVMAALRTAGRPSGVNDAMIAGIVRTHRATLATRNVKHFAEVGLDLVDPWGAERTGPG